MTRFLTNALKSNEETLAIGNQLLDVFRIGLVNPEELRALLETSFANADFPTDMFLTTDGT